MNILCIGYFDKHSRFFLGIKKALNSQTHYLNLEIKSIHFSGFLYTFLRFKLSSWLSMKAWLHAILNKKKYLQVINHDTCYKDIDFKNLINYHLDLNVTVSQKNLLLQALAYIDIIELTILKKKPDLIVLIGDSKLSIETCMALAKKHKIKIYFIENGPFNTTIFDSRGVNANATIRNFEIKEKILITVEQKRAINDFIEKPKFPKYKRSPVYRGMDFVLEFLFAKSFIYPPDLIYTDIVSSRFFSKIHNKDYSIHLDKKTKTYLLILQVPMDVNMICHSPFFKDHTNLVKAVHKNLPNNSKLVLREHPLYRGKYEEELYSYAKKHHIYIDKNPSLKNSLSLADVVVVNNSTVGIEAISLKKTVVVLGNSYYDNPKICLKYQQKDDLKLLLEKALKFKPKEKNINAFLQEFLFNYLIQGFITDKELIAAKIISNKIIQEPLN